MVADDSFHLPSAEATRALHVASSLLEWASSDENLCTLKEFGRKLISALNEVVRGAVVTVRGTKTLNMQCLWSSYNALILSTKSREQWSEFLSGSLQVPPCAILHQYIMQHLIDRLLKEQFPLKCYDNINSSIEELSEIEENALRYVSGYIIRSAIEYIELKNHPMKEALLHGLLELCTEDCIEDRSTSWITTVDRGGLIHVNHSAFRFFHSIEMEVRNHFNESTQGNSTIQDTVCMDIDVVYYWNVCQQLLLEKEKDELLKIIVLKYVNLRGHSFAASIMELYKQKAKKTTQKSKGLRKKV